MMLGAASEDSSDAIVLLSSSVNQDGRSSSLTAPNGPAQQDAILTALAAANAAPADLNILQVCRSARRSLLRHDDQWCKYGGFCSLIMRIHD